MPEYRHDPILDRRVIIAAERAARPYTARADPSARSGPEHCPFCPGHEDHTPPETYRTGPGAPDTAGWTVRVVPNLYPIVGGDAASGTGDATGAHEVIILSPDHDAGFAQVTHDQAVGARLVMRDRARVHLDAGRAFVSGFVNQGRAAGASIEHPHAQIVAPDAPSAAVVAMTERFTTDLVAREIADARKANLVVAEGPAMAWCPPASWSPYLMRVAHRSTRARFDEATDAEIRVVGVTLHAALGRVAATLGEVAYNVVVHTAPPGIRSAEMHWHLEIVPRVSVVAGFELGSGIYANSMAPEQAAAFLRGD